MIGDPVLVPLGDRWLLGHVTPFGLQASIENFPSVCEGIRHVQAIEHRRPAVEAGAVRLSPRDWAILLAVAAGGASNAQAARHCGTSYSASLRSLCKLGVAGLVAQVDGAGFTATAEGIALARAIREP